MMYHWWHNDNIVLDGDKVNDKGIVQILAMPPYQLHVESWNEKEW